jgi:hypothetical protein
VHRRSLGRVEEQPVLGALAHEVKVTGVALLERIDRGAVVLEVARDQRRLAGIVRLVAGRRQAGRRSRGRVCLGREVGEAVLRARKTSSAIWRHRLRR